jgi:hypothetical protein
MSGNNDSRIIRPDGMSAKAEAVTIKLYETEFPLPSREPADFRKLCMRPMRVDNPITGVPNIVETLAINADTALVIVEMHHALRVRDEQISELKEQLIALKDQICTLERRFDDPAEHDRKDGYDGIE